jgi:hypothetical protein
VQRRADPRGVRLAAVRWAAASTVRLEQLGRRRGIGAIVAVAVFVALALVATWPFAVHPGSTLTAPIGYDVSSSVGKFEAIVREGTTPFSGGTLQTIAAPEGVSLTPGLDAVSVLSSLPLWLGTAAVGGIAAHGVLTVLGLVLTACAAFGLVRWATASTGAALVAGIAAGFFGHMRLLATAAPTYTHLWAYILVLWAFAALIVRPGRRAALLAGASTLPAMFWTPYYTLHVLVAALASGAMTFAVLARLEGARRAATTIALAAAPVVAGLAAYLLIGLGSSFSDVPTRAAEDLFNQSAHPLMYVVPGYGAWAWGEDPYDTLVEAVPRAANTNLYLGISTLLLAAVALAWLARGLARAASRRHAGPLRTPSRAAALGLVATATAVLAVLWSLPPTLDVLGADIPTPGSITAELAPALRAGQRFVMLVMVAVAALAGIGAARLLRRIRPAHLGAAAAALIAVVLAIDTAAVPDYARTTDVPASPALAALADAPPGITVHYQSPAWGTLAVGAVARPCVLQTQHDHPLVNGCNLDEDPAVLARLGELSDPSCATLDRLRAGGVRYVILDHGLPAASCPGASRMRPLAADADFSVLRLGTG